MKVFCMQCGKSTEYIGLQNKPSGCSSCGEPFAGCSSQASSSGETKKNESSGHFLIEGTEFDKMALAKLFTCEFIQD